MNQPTSNGNGQPRTAREVAGLCLSKGILPIPVPFRSKGPVLAAWQDLRPTVADLDALFPTGQLSNLGVLLGAPSKGLVDVDLDVIEAIRAADCFLPPTQWVSGRQSKPRAHRWYVVPDPPNKAQTAFKDIDGAMILEVRSTGAQTVFWGEHESGEQIAWHEQHGEPTHTAFANVLAPCCKLAAAALLGRHWPKKGTRDEAALALTGGLLKAGMDGADVTEFVRAVVMAAGDEEVAMRSRKAEGTAAKLQAGKRTTGWPRLAELLGADGPQVVCRVQEWLGLTRRGAQPVPPSVPPAPYQPFPVEALPEPARTYVVQAAAALGCDPAYLALPTLALLASLIGNTREVRLKRDWHEPSVVWAAVIGDSGTLKSPALKMVVGPLYRMQKELLRRFKAEMEQYHKDKEEYDQRARDAMKADKPFKEDPPEKPTLVRVVTGDVTIERLAQLLEDNPRGLLLCRDELGGWLTSFQRYKGKAGGSDLPNWLEMYRAETIVVDRKTGDRPTLFIPRAAVSVCGGIQEGTLSRVLTTEYFEAGMAARLLMGMPPKRRKRWTEAEVCPEVREAYEDILRKLLALSMDRDTQGEKVPFAVKLTPEAKKRWVAFYEEWARQQAGAEGEQAACLSKLEGYAARLALIHHVVTHVGDDDMDDSDPVEPASIEAGVTLTKWFAYEARRIYAALRESEEARQVRRLIEFIRSRGGTITARRLRLSNTSRYRTTEDAEAALDALATAGLADWVDAPPGPDGGRPSRTLRLRPDTTCFKTYETPGDEDDDEDDGGGVVATEPPTKPPSPCGIPEDSEGYVGSEACSTDTKAPEEGLPPAGAPEGPGGVSLGALGNGSVARPGEEEPRWTSPRTAESAYTPCFKTYETPAFRLVTDAAGLDALRGALGDAEEVAIDTETTGLDPRQDRVRLLQVAVPTIDGGTFPYLMDCFAVSPAPLFPTLAEKTLIAHHAAFDLSMLAGLGFVPGPVRCTMLLSQLLHGTRKAKGFHKLEQVAEREIGRKLNKSAQQSDWSGSLSAEQLAYAAVDAAVLPPLYASLQERLTAAGMVGVADIECRCLPAMAWLSRSGAPFDKAAWDTLAEEAAKEAEALADRLDTEAPQRDGYLQRKGAWNWNSRADVLEVFRLLGVKLDDTTDDTLAGTDHPLAALLREHRSAQKLVSTYGAGWCKGAYHGGRLYAEWKQLGCLTGRMASAAPNLQNLPRDPRYRRCFAAPPGRVLVKADYSQIELRIACKIAREKAMLEAYRRGDDLHTLTARKMTGRQEVTREERQVAKPVNFGLIYGLGAASLRQKAKSEYGLELTLEDARRYSRAFFEAYPGIARWHESIRSGQEAETRTLAGRRSVVKPDAFYGLKANYAVQGTGGDGVKLALALLYERRDQIPGAFPVLAVHDEIVIECAADKAEAAAAWLKAAMVDAMAPLIAPVPVDVEVKVGRTWGG
jgi:DNA polymerase I-like protein with 3'-5' exonuclease and polymerase domains